MKTQVSTSASVCHVSILITFSRCQLDLAGYGQGRVEKTSSERQNQQFCDYWHGKSIDPITPSKFPYVASLGPEGGKIILPFGPKSGPGNQIVITRSYEATFLRILRLREKDIGRDGGAVLTGQPGIGTLP